MSLYDAATTRIERRSLVIAVALLCCLLALPAAAEEDAREKALKLYGEGRYEQALPLFEALDAAGEADGAMLYRLYFCQRHVKDPGARKTQERARLQLESEAGDSPDLEAPFYLANAYRNIGRLTDMGRVATVATARVEKGDLPQPSTGIEMFRLGKLYADLGREEEAADWYSRAIDLLAGETAQSAPPYAAWAARYLAERALERGDLDAAARYYAFLPMEGKEALPDLENMATISCRAGRYGQAAEAWLKVERLDPANANRSRYARHLATMAEGLELLPETAPDGRAWTELSKEELQSLQTERVEGARQLVATTVKIGGLMRKVSAAADEALGQSAAVAKLDKQFQSVSHLMLQSLQPRMDEAKPYFVAAALEFAIKRYGIRETAFFGGYAPLIFKADQWLLKSQLQQQMGQAPAAAEGVTFGERAEELLLALRETLGERAEIAKLEKLLAKLEKKIG